MINQYLSLLSGLRVVVTTLHNQNYYSFYNRTLCIHSCFTYGKAIAFARGVQIGRLLAKCDP